MPDIAHGTRDENGVWHPDNPADYPPMDVHGQLPWSTLDQSAKHWQARKKWWLGRGVDDITPRLQSAGMIRTGKHGRVSQGVSRFDPFLAELLYTWLCPPGGHIYDPCAGGPVRGIVAAELGYDYDGRDISTAQVQANSNALDRWGTTPGAATWRIQSGVEPAGEQWADMVLTCPPYHNLERYSDDPRDLSAMRWPAFLDAHQQMVTNAAQALKQDRFLAWVIGDVRDHKGHLRGLPAHTAHHIRAAGLHITNELILIAPPGTRAKTMRRPWEACRTTTRRHQHVLIAVKGDRRTGTRNVTTPC